MWYYVNGAFVSKDEAKLSVQDLGLIRGYGVFDFLRTYGGRPFHIKEHLQRLKFSAGHIGLVLPNSLEEIATIVDTLLKKNQPSDAAIKIIATGGISPDQFSFDQKPSLIVSVYPLTPLHESYYTRGINVVTTSLSRSFPMSKTTQYAPAIVAMQQGRRQNAQEAIYINAKQELLEATTSNFFAFKNGTLYTCASDEILVGITSAVVLQLAKEHFPIQKQAISLTDLPFLEEAFVTASNKEILPVTAINGNPIGQGIIGDKTKLLQKLFQDYTRQSLWPDLKIPRYTQTTSRIDFWLA